MDKPKTQEELEDEKYPAKDFNKKIFNFSKEELEEINPLEDATRLVNTLLTLGQIAQRAKDSYVSGPVLNRLGVKKSQDSKFSYDLIQNRVIVYEPRIWCSACDSKRAEFKYQEKVFCRDCIETVKEQLAQPLVEEKKEKKKRVSKA